MGVLRGWQVLQVLHRERLGQGSNIIPLAADFLLFPPFQKDCRLSMPVIPSYSGVGHREGTRDLERAARLPGDWTVCIPHTSGGSMRAPSLSRSSFFSFSMAARISGG